MTMRQAGVGLGFMLVLLALPLKAQDSHYWNLQYGTRSTLLGGAVIGSVEDLGSVYYNPGVLALQLQPSFLLSGRVYDYTSLNLRDPEGDQGEIISTRTIRPAPSLFAGSFSIPAWKKHHFAYSTLSRQRFRLNLGSRLVDLPSTPGQDRSAASLEFGHTLNELWVGATWSYQLAHNMGIGVSQFVAQREQRENTTLTDQELAGADNTYTGFYRIDSYRYTHYGILWKFGLEVLQEPFAFGLNLTTPRVHVTGDGNRFFNNTEIGLDRNGDGEPEENRLESSHQSRLKSRYKSSWALGIGLRYRFGQTSLHASAEWYSKVRPFVVIPAAPYEDPDTGVVEDLSITHALRAITNFGAGFEHAFSKKFALSGSFISDRSAKDFESGTNLVVTDWNYYHAALGTVVSLAAVELTLGATYIFTNKRPVREVEPFDPEADRPETLVISVTGWKFIFGFTLNL